MKRTFLIVAAAMLTFPLGQSARADSPAPPAVENAPPARVPLRILESRRLQLRSDKEKNLPLVTIAASPEGEKVEPLDFADGKPAGQMNVLPTTEKAPLLEAFAAGTLKPAGPQADAETVMFLVGPELNTGEKWAPAELTLDQRQKAFTLTVETWTDDGLRHKNVPGRDAYLISLGKLSSAEYVFRVVSRRFRNEVGPSQSYALKGLDNGVDRFRIVAAKDAAKSEPFAFRDADLEESELPAEAKNLLWQTPAYFWQRLAPTDILKAAPQVKVGQFYPNKVEAFLNLNTKSMAGSPDLINPKDQLPPSVAILGPLLNSGEWMTLREVLWRGDKMTVKVDVWRDNSGRYENVRRYPVIVVPVATPGKLAKFDVSVEWNTLLAPAPGGFYQPTPRASAVSTVHVETMAANREK